jgi:hypothetical protein
MGGFYGRPTIPSMPGMMKVELPETFCVGQGESGREGDDFRAFSSAQSCPAVNTVLQSIRDEVVTFRTKQELSLSSGI